MAGACKHRLIIAPSPLRPRKAPAAIGLLLVALAAASCQTAADPTSVHRRPSEPNHHAPTATSTEPRNAEDDEADAAEVAALHQASTPSHLAWPALSDDEHAEAVAGLTRFANHAAEQLDTPLQRHESSFFLIFTDLPDADAQRWAALLDRMYTRLLTKFALPRDTNLFRGKAMVLVFENPEDYRRFQRELHKTDPAESVGMCHNFSSGNVHIAFHHDDDEDRFARVLTHEAAHGFAHRYRSRASVPSWINEGFAEWVAHSVVPDSATARNMVRRTREQLIRRGSLEGFFDAERIETWQYGVAFTLTEHMIHRDRAGYIAFFDAVKDGTPWQDALEQHYGMSRDELVALYSKAMDVPDLEQ